MNKVQYKILRWNDSISVESIDNFICIIQKNEYKIQNPTSYNFCVRDMKKYYAAPNRKINFFIALINNNIIGTIGLKDLGNNAAELRKFYIDCNFRRIGLGTNLYKETIKSAIKSQYKIIYASTMIAKIQVKEFYLNKGFEQIEESKLPSSFKVQSLDKLFFKINLTD